MEKAIGAEAKLKLELVDGKLMISLVYDGKGVDGQVGISVDSDYFIDQLAGLIPGDSVIEATALAALKLGLKNVKV
jgi:hypothetical protein